MESDETTKKLPLILNCLLLAFGSTGGPLILRLYFLRGGKRVWLSAFLETGGWPAILIPLLIAYLRRRKNQGSAVAKAFLINPRIFVSFAVIGILTGLDDYFYAYGVGFLPISTTALIIATQLAFTAFFAFIVVRQKFTAYSVNAVVLLTMGAGVLAMHSSGDRPAGVSKRDYLVGFFMTLAASALYGFVLPLIELAYSKGKKEITYTLVMEAQLVMSIFATLFCTAGMLINKDFQGMGHEAKTYELGEAMYYVVLILSAISWQCFFLGAVGVVFCASSLLSGIIIAVALPMVEILSVVFYHESFKVEKAVSLILCIWGFVSYFYGEMKKEQQKKKKNSSSVGDKTQMTELVVAP